MTGTPTPTTMPELLHQTLAMLLSELVDGTQSDAAWILNRGDAGLLRSLDRLSAARASTVPASGGASIAAHADHLRYGLSLMNRWSQGEHPFADADWGPSWTRLVVSDDEWRERRDALRREVAAWQEAVGIVRPLMPMELSGLMASVVHLGYHLGAMRQIDRTMRGPSEGEQRI